MSEWQPIDDSTPCNTDILLSGHGYNDPKNERFVCQGMIEANGNVIAYGFDGMEDCRFADKWMPLPPAPDLCNDKKQDKTVEVLKGVRDCLAAYIKTDNQNGWLAEKPKQQLTALNTLIEGK